LEIGIDWAFANRVGPDWQTKIVPSTKATTQERWATGFKAPPECENNTASGLDVASLVFGLRRNLNLRRWLAS
jgi:hypothetical protein